MMSSRFIGVLLCISAVMGMLITLGGIILIWMLKPPVIQLVNTNWQLLESTLQSTSLGLSLAEESLEATTTSLETLQSSIATLALSLEDLDPIVETLSTLVAKDLPKTITSTQISLESAQKSAKLIDDLLKLLTAIPFFPGDVYNPSVPLNIALGQVSNSLDALPLTFLALEESFIQTQSNLAVMKADIELIAMDIETINSNLIASQEVIAQYSTTMLDLLKQTNLLQEKMPAFFNITAWILTIGLAWLFTTQIGLFVQGLEILQRSSKANTS